MQWVSLNSSSWLDLVKIEILRLGTWLLMCWRVWAITLWRLLMKTPKNTKQYRYFLENYGKHPVLILVVVEFTECTLEYFEKLFEVQMTENITKSITIVAENPAVMYYVIEYLYTKKINMNEVINIRTVFINIYSYNQHSFHLLKFVNQTFHLLIFI